MWLLVPKPQLHQLHDRTTLSALLLHVRVRRGTGEAKDGRRRERRSEGAKAGGKDRGKGGSERASERASEGARARAREREREREQTEDGAA